MSKKKEENISNNPFKNDDIEDINEAVEQFNNTSAEENVEEQSQEKSSDAENKLKEDFENLNNQYIRLAADFDNYRKRQESERESLIKFGMEQALKKMIEIADNFSRAEKAMSTIDDCEKAKESFYVLNKQFNDSLSKLGLEEIKAEGEMFDPNLHEAVMQVPTDEKPEETIMQELQKGYKYGEKVLRPSMVSVAVSK